MDSQQKPTDVLLDNDSVDSIDLLELMYRLLAHWKIIVCSGLACAIAAAVITIYFITPLYRAASEIYVLGRSDSVINMSDLQIGAALTNDYIEVFDVWEVHEAVISNLGLDYTYSEIGNMIQISNPTNSRVLKITVTSSSAEEAANIANEYAIVASEYIADTMSTDKPSLMSIALVPTNPISPSKSKNTVIGFLAGIVLAAGVYVVLFILDDKYKTSEDIRKYAGMVTLAVIPLQDSDKDKQKEQKSSSISHSRG